MIPPRYSGSRLAWALDLIAVKKGADDVEGGLPGLRPFCAKFQHIYPGLFYECGYWDGSTGLSFKEWAAALTVDGWMIRCAILFEDGNGFVSAQVFNRREDLEEEWNLIKWGALRYEWSQQLALPFPF